MFKPDLLRPQKEAYFALCMAAQMPTACHMDAHTHAGNKAQHITAQHSTAQHSTAQHSTAQHSTAQHSTAQHSTAQHSTAQHSPPPCHVYMLSCLSFLVIDNKAAHALDQSSNNLHSLIDVLQQCHGVLSAWVAWHAARVQVLHSAHLWVSSSKAHELDDLVALIEAPPLTTLQLPNRPTLPTPECSHSFVRCMSFLSSWGYMTAVMHLSTLCPSPSSLEYRKRPLDSVSLH